LNYKIAISSLQAKMAQQGKQIEGGDRLACAYSSVKVVLLANGNRYEVDSNTFFHVVKPSVHLKYCPVPKLRFNFLQMFASIVCGI
jgi:hypothetical protein